jgi:hypothetical protein
MITWHVEGQSRAASGRGAAMLQVFYAVYCGHIAVKPERGAHMNPIAGPGGGPAMRGGLRP